MAEPTPPQAAAPAPPPVSEITISPENKKEYPILWWTTWFSNAETFEGVLTDDCGLPYNCRHTLDRSKYDEAKLIAFHGHNQFKTRDLPPLQDVTENRKAWVFNTAESPNKLAYNQKWLDYFKYSWTYHFGADFTEHYYFTAGHFWANAVINLASRPPLITLARKNKHRLHGFHALDRRPLAPVAWIVSNCNADNGRHFMINQLQKYVKVDIYGHCIPNRSWPKQEDGITEMSAEELVSHYKFYLAIENSNCEDYVTEKLERTLAAGTVPVVDGPKDYSRFRPAEMSLIEYNDFGSPEALGAYLTDLDRDDDLYSEYLSFRSPRTAENTDEIGRVKVDYPGTFNQNYKTRLLPWFVDNWDLETDGGSGTLAETKEWLSTDPRPTGRSKWGHQWGADIQGARCGLCQLARDLAEGDAVIDPKKHMMVDQTCEFRKHYKTQWMIEFYAYWILFGMMVVGGLCYLAFTRKGRARAQPYAKRAQETWSGIMMRVRPQHQYKGILEE